MSISLSKGQKVSLDKSMVKALVGLGWDINKYDGGTDFDLDTCAFLLGANGKVASDADFIFYNQLKSRNDAVIHTGDNLTGLGDGDDEIIIIDFSKIPADVEKIAITATIHDSEERRQNFGQVANAYVRVAKIESENDTTGEEALRFDLCEDFSIETAVVICEIYKNNGVWKFNAVAAGYQGGLAALCNDFGVNI